MDDAMRANVAAYEQTVRSTLALVETFEKTDWDLPTDCPGWTVKDQVAHLAAIECMLLGDAQPEHRPPEDLPHVRSDFGRRMEVGVDARRPTPGPAIAAELADALERRLVALESIDPHQQAQLPSGAMGTYTEFMAFRAIDCWTHEQDIRRAVGRPGNLDAPAGRCFWEVMSRGLPMVVAKRAGAAPGQSATLTISGSPPRDLAVLVDPDGRGRFAPHLTGAPTVTLRMDWETYVRLTGGRCGPDVVSVGVEGDEDLGARILRSMALTP